MEGIHWIMTEVAKQLCGSQGHNKWRTMKCLDIKTAILT
jgi:hypothetical protein